VVIGIGSGVGMDVVMAVYPRHKAVVDTFVARGEVIGIGPFTDKGGNMAIFRSRGAAEEFVAQDPFILEGLIKSYDIRDWGDQMLV
jgi:uncharacterized protein YciI